MPVPAAAAPSSKKTKRLLAAYGVRSPCGFERIEPGGSGGPAGSEGSISIL
jgi:hypothetical protein